MLLWPQLCEHYDDPGHEVGPDTNNEKNEANQASEDQNSDDLFPARGWCCPVFQGRCREIRKHPKINIGMLCSWSWRLASEPEKQGNPLKGIYQKTPREDDVRIVKESLLRGGTF